jgi:hypothetical protein
MVSVRRGSIQTAFGRRELRRGVTGQWEQLHSEELHNFLSLPNIFRAIRSMYIREWGM